MSAAETARRRFVKINDKASFGSGQEASIAWLPPLKDKPHENFTASVGCQPIRGV
jgi:hypothetical protein